MRRLEKIILCVSFLTRFHIFPQRENLLYAAGPYSCVSYNVVGTFCRCLTHIVHFWDYLSPQGISQHVPDVEGQLGRKSHSTTLHPAGGGRVGLRKFSIRKSVSCPHVFLWHESEEKSANNVHKFVKYSRNTLSPRVVVHFHDLGTLP